VVNRLIELNDRCVRDHGINLDGMIEISGVLLSYALVVVYIGVVVGFALGVMGAENVQVVPYLW